MAENEGPEVQNAVQNAILDAVRERVASLSVNATVADATDCYGKNTAGDGYAKNVCTLVNAVPPGVSELLGEGSQPKKR
ncbi:hypothetical protein JL475_33970 [Streptomyces sp. M2CJ-2]|uniref:hypothetical protein n=1 Tax=Streptomyces sp. M2CJ-2 TaxID=2803948 RepID=UPI001926060E|nr:hypothetical protein [Streptomyces sp. M2CJ-2]MBL3670871.1 hypothetical protein [Streptomyces sp. M2CJ-2]